MGIVTRTNSASISWPDNYGFSKSGSTWALFLWTGLSLMFGVSAQSGEPTTAITGAVEVTIQSGVTVGASLSGVDTVLVTINARGAAIAGFDFTFAYEISEFEIIDALPGSFLDSCRWEYFAVRRNVACAGPCPSGLLKVVALSSMTNSDPNDSQSGLQEGHFPADGSSLVKLLLRRSDTTRGYIQPASWSGALRFFWVDCGDNSLSSMSGNDLYLAREVIDVDSTVLSDIPSDAFPTYGGPLAGCLTASPYNSPKSLTILRNGYVDLFVDESPAAGPDTTD